MKLLTNLNLLKNQILNGVIHNAIEAPASPAQGQLYFNTTSKKLFVGKDVSGTVVWVEIGVFYDINVTIVNDKVTLQLNGTDNSTDNVTFTGSGAITVSRTDANTIDISAPTEQSTEEPLVIKFDSGTNEGTDLYTFDGSTAKNVNFIGGTDVDLNTTAGTVTVNHGSVTRTDTTGTASPDFNGTFTAVDGITTSSTGHITAVNLKTITVPTETTLSKVDEGTGTWLTGLNVSNHAITLSRSDATTAKITVGQLEVVKAEGVSNGNVLIGNDLTVTGNLTIQGTTTTLNTEEVNIEDNLILINSNQTGTPATSLVGGIEVNRGAETNYRLVFVENTEDFRVGKYDDNVDPVINGLQPVLTRDETTNLVEGDVLVWDATAKKAVGKTFDELALPNKYAVSITELEANQTYTITHDLGTTDVVYSVKDNTNTMVLADVVVTGSNTITVTVGQINSITSLRVVVIG